jgi:hypothetical protein
MELKRPCLIKLASTGLLASTLLVGTAAVAQEPARPEPAALPPASRCAELYRLYWEYVGDWVFYADGNRPAVELGNYHCQQGRLEEGSRALEAVLRRNKMPFPKELPPDGSRHSLAEGSGW